MWSTIRYRRLQAVAIALLAALVTTCAVVAPLYSRAMQQALAKVELSRVTPAVRGIEISVSHPANDFDDTALPDPDQLAAAVPAGVRRHFERPLISQTATVLFHPVGQLQATGPLLWRTGSCRLLRITQGRCAAQSGEIAVSTADQRGLHLDVGSQVTVEGVATDPDAPPPTTVLTVVGIYRQRPSPSWFGLLLTGRSGIPGGDTQGHDAWVTTSATFTSPAVPPLPEPAVEADFALRTRDVGADQLQALGRSLTSFGRQLQIQPALSRYRLFTGLPSIARDAAHQARQSRVTVPLLMLQLALLAVVVLWLVLGAAMEQRRPETAVAMLRGRGRSGARGLLLRELLPVVLAGVPVGVVAALGLGWVARHGYLPGSAPFEIGRDAALALVGSVLALVVVTVLAALQLTREPVERLLRRVPVRRSGWSLGVVETLIVAASGSAVVAFLTGGLSGPIALVAPSLLALVVGLLLAHVTTPLAAAVGRRLLRAGRVGTGISVLDAARTPASRRTVAIVTVASALLVFAGTAVAVGGRNRAAAAEQQAGAILTARVTSDDVAGVRAALREVDPSGRRVTPVVSAFPPAKNSEQTMAVDPRGFAATALFSHARVPALGALAPTTAPPIRLVGDRLAVTVATPRLSSAAQRTDAPVNLDLEVLNASGDVGRVSLGALPTGAASIRRLGAELHCTRPCYLVGVSISTLPQARVTGEVDLSDLATSTGGGAPTSVGLGPTSAWTPLHSNGSTMTPRSDDAGSLAVQVTTTGAQRSTMNQAWLPTRLPVIVVGPPTAAEARPSFTMTGLDGDDRTAYAVGRLPRVPGGSLQTTLVSLDLATRGTSADPTDRVEVWFARDDPALYRRVSAALARRGLHLTETTRLGDVRATYDASTAAWSLGLGIVVGVAALLVALLVVVVLAVTTWRTRARDLAALRLTGMTRRTSRRIATLAQLPALLVAVVAGTLCGAVGARLSMPDIPLFPSAPAVPTLDLSVPWPTVLAVAAAALVLLVATGWLAGSAIARRADLQRVREQL